MTAELGWFAKLYHIGKWCQENCEGQHKIILLQRHPHRGLETTSTTGDFEATTSVRAAPHCWLTFEHAHDAVMYRLAWGE